MLSALRTGILAACGTSRNRSHTSEAESTTRCYSGRALLCQALCRCRWLRLVDDQMIGQVLHDRCHIVITVTTKLHLDVAVIHAACGEQRVE